ncbi:MAG TPA: hypothetical protein VN908_12450 [Gemmatimonadales bacterium]|nr:hypothetical protein [Gemmatimonadales bacterium]
MAIRGKRATNDDVVERLETLLIVQLGLAGVSQRAIREIVECDLNRVSRIVKQLNRRSTKGEK